MRGFRSSRIALTEESAISCEVIIARRSRPGSPWMPTPSSSSPGGRSKVGLPLAGVVQALSATPKLREFVDLPGQRLHPLQRRGLFGRGARYLLHEQGSRRCRAARRCTDCR